MFRQIWRGLAPAVLMLVAIAGNAHAQGVDATKVQEWKSKAKSLRARWEPLLAETRTPGLAVAVVAGDEVILLEAFGKRDVQKNLPADTNTLFYIASSTKSFVAMAITLLAEEGKLNLDAPVKKYLPRFQLADAKATEAITLRDLLSHRPGLNHPAISFAEAYSGQIDEEKFYRLLATATPRNTFSYSNLHFTLLGRVIQAVTGKHWREFVEQRILKPAGMKRTVCSGRALWSDSNAATFTDPRNWNQPILAHKTDRTMHAAGGMAASAADLATWLRLNMNGGKVGGKQVIPATVVKKMQEQQIENRSNFGPFERTGYGLGWYTSVYKGRANIHHFGGYEGARAHVSFMPEAGLGVVVVMNTQGAMPEIIAADIYDKLLGLGAPDMVEMARQRFAQDEARAQQRPQLTGPNPADGGLTLAVRYAGEYAHPDWGTVTVRVDNGRMTMKIGDLDTELFSTGENKLKVRHTGTSDAEFTVSGGQATALIMQIDNSPVEFRRK